ncbi:hypothetical protein EGW08_002170 [Elysia chlorotica]|uniref:Uncharacterized protein n=1 Tax=Elysia chlorotica TaxID=188477 RepID=A0A3S1BJZ3_ELYCH|nr:hypothetical protein EGW08_002170 [Elysia chlorotica]
MAGKPINFSRIVQQMKTSRSFLSDRHVKVISPGGFPYEAYNGKAEITPWSILHLLEFSRDVFFSRTASHDRCFLDIDKISENHLMFMACTTTKIWPSLYNRSVCKTSLVLNSELVNVGRTSFVIKTLIGVENADTPLCENFVQPVLIDSATRKPSPPPEWWLNKYSNTLKGSGSGLKLVRQVVPQNGVLHRYQTKISASDLDSFWHANWSSYLRNSYNALAEHFVGKNGAGQTASAFRKSKQFSLLYLREANLNDTLDIHLWKDPQNTNLYKFQFYKESDVICESEIELYPPDPDA